MGKLSGIMVNYDNDMLYNDDEGYDNDNGIWFSYSPKRTPKRLNFP
jgi:hypothetical protein